MHPQLVEVNNLYLQIENYIDPTPEYLNSLTEKGWAEIQKNKTEASKTYQIAIDQLGSILGGLSQAEIIEGYVQGCRLLQRGLSGHMSQHFSQEYIPVMIDAVRKPHLHTAWIFLQALADNLGREISPLVIEALDIQGVNETALSIVEQLHIVEALPKVHMLTHDNNARIAFLADSIGKKFET